MLTNFFSKSKPIATLTILFLFLCYYLVAMINGFMPLKDFFKLPLFLLILGVYNFIAAKNALTFDNSYGFLFFVLLMGIFPESFMVNSTFYASITILLFLRKVYSLKSDKNLIQKYFDGGLWLGISFLIEPFTLVFVFLLYVAIIIHQRITIQALLVPIIGFAPPVFLYYTYHFWYNTLERFDKLLNWTSNFDVSLYQNTNYQLTLGLVGFFTLLAIFLKTPKTLSIKNSFRKNWILVLLNLAVAIILIILLPEKNGTELSFLFFPIAIILANAIELYENDWFIDIVPMLFFVCTLVVNIT